MKKDNFAYDVLYFSKFQRINNLIPGADENVRTALSDFGDIRPSCVDVP